MTEPCNCHPDYHELGVHAPGVVPVDRAALNEQRERFALFVLESVNTEGFPRVSAFTCETFEKDGLIERTGDPSAPFRLTTAGAARLAAAPPRDENADV